MPRFALVPIFALAAVLFACGESSTDSPVSQDQLNLLRSDYQRKNPDAQVGLVTAVLTHERLASVGSVPVKDFSMGDVVSFVDPSGDIIATGQVEAIDNNRLEVRYAAPTGDRDPMVGDLAVRAIK
jgi:hypothetical protein